MKILNVVGARPNLMKMASLTKVIKQRSQVSSVLLHTGQHYDDNMSRIFFDELQLPTPDIYLGVGSGSHAEVTAKIMVAFEKVLAEHHPDWVVVVGDVNSTIACTITASKLHIPVAHIEAGLRSFDRRMPEEINRVVTDALSSLLFTTERSANENLIAEGVAPEKIHFVGNLMIDTLLQHRERAAQSQTLQRFGLEPKSYGVLTLHRPSNVDNSEQMTGIIEALALVQSQLPLVFPVHPRTAVRLREFGLWARVKQLPDLHICEPLGYFDFLQLMAQSGVVLTDSGGIQEETTILDVPCLTLRENTERPITISEGTNRLIGIDPDRIVPEIERILQGDVPQGRIPALWDGKAAERIVEVLLNQRNSPT